MTKKDEILAKKAAKLEAERQRLEGLKAYERQASAQYKDAGSGPILICGIDEAGRGPFAGPVVAGAVILDYEDPDREILYLNDSKKLSEKKREALYQEILEKAIAVGVGYAGPEMIDDMNILNATYHAMRMAIRNLQAPSGKKELTKSPAPDMVIRPDHILADAVHIPDIRIPQQGIIKGDAKSVSIAAASIVAKVTRDHLMYEYDRIYPEYGFASHKGYGTRAHIEAIRQYGMTPIHRRSFIHFQ